MTPILERVLLNAAAADGAGNAQLVADYRHLELVLGTTGTANLTVRVQVSNQETPPDWEAAQSPTNQWEYAQLKDLEDGSSIDGDTGVAFAAADANRQFEVNTNRVRWINGIVSSYVAGAATLKLLAAKD